MRKYLLCGFLVLLVPACGSKAVGPADVESATSAIAQHLPSGWKVASRLDGQLPTGHYWGDWNRDYKGPRGRLINVLGPNSVELSWRDMSGVPRHDALAKESLQVWLMPAKYVET